MQKQLILQIAVMKNLNKENIDKDSATAFATVHDCIHAIDIMNLEEEEKRKKLISSLQGFWHGESKFVAGCKREHIRKIVKIAFGVGNEKDEHLNKELNSFTFKELYLYYCYIERMAKVDLYFSKLLRNSYKIKRGNKTAVQNITEKQRDKEEKELEKVEKMSKEEIWKYEIFDKQQDIYYFKEICTSEAYSAQDKVVIAKLLKEYWQTIEKWDGNHVSKKQVVKIEKIKEILKPL